MKRGEPFVLCAERQGSLPWLFICRIGAGIAGATIPTAQAYIASFHTAGVLREDYPASGKGFYEY